MRRLIAAALALAVPGPPSGSSLAEAPSRYARLDGHRVHYKMVGSGQETLIFVHGWTCDIEPDLGGLPRVAVLRRALRSSAA